MANTHETSINKESKALVIHNVKKSFYCEAVQMVGEVIRCDKLCSYCKDMVSEQCTIPSASPRFIVDERNGCIGIRDTKHQKFNESNGLNQDMPDVVAFEMGTEINTGNFITWDLRPEIIKSFYNRCAILNEG